MKSSAPRLTAVALLLAAIGRAQDAPTPQERPRPPEGSRVINLPSAEAPAGGTLGVLFTHRFKNPLNIGTERNFYTLDGGADSVLGISYSPTDRLEISFDRSSLDADYELAAKYRLLRMTRGRPFAIALRIGGNAVTVETTENRESFFVQAIASVAIGRCCRLTAAPTYASNTELFRDVFNVPVALSIAITPTINLHGELYPKNRDFTETPARHVPPPVDFVSGRQTHNGWIASIEKTVLRHRFALTVGNMRGTTVDQYVASDLRGGIPHDVYLGFNLVRQWKLK